MEGKTSFSGNHRAGNFDSTDSTSSGNGGHVFGRPGSCARSDVERIQLVRKSAVTLVEVVMAGQKGLPTGMKLLAAEATGVR